MCLCCGSRCVILFAGIWTLVQGVLWALLAILGISLYNCNIEVTYDKNDPASAAYWLYFVYFYNPECAKLPEEFDFLGDILENIPDSVVYTTPAGGVWPESFDSAESTKSIVISYTVLSLLWAVTSIILIVGGAIKVRSSLAYIPWILVSAANIVLDIVAAIMFALQANQAQTLSGLWELIGMDSIPDYGGADYTNLAGSLDGVTMIPSVVMALVSSRVGIIWLINVLLFTCVIMATYRITRDKDKDSRLPTYPHQTETDNNKTRDEPYPPRQDNTTDNNAPQYNNNNNAPQYNNLNDHQYDYASDSGFPNDRRPFSYTPDDPKMTSQPPRLQHIPRAGLNAAQKEPDYLECVEPTPWFHASAPADPEGYEPPRKVPDPRGYDTPVRRPAPNMSDPRGYETPMKRPAPDVPRVEPDPRGYENVARRLATDVPRVESDPRGYEKPARRSATDVPRVEPDPRGYENLARRPAPDVPRVESDPRGYENVARKPVPDLSRVESDRSQYRPHVERQRSRPTSYDDVMPSSQETPQDRGQESVRNLVARLSSSVRTDELRNHLPWSYFGPRNAPMKQPKPKPVDEEELEKPPVPVPDYTLHFGKTQRPSASRWSESSSTSS
ncbi:uncharacterized protein [Periplaneta americana]